MSSRPTKPPSASRRRNTHLDLARMHAANDKITMLTCYDASFARVCESAGVEALLIGDSLGMVLQGHDSTIPVTLDDVAYHTRAVARGCELPLIIADLTFGSYQESTQQAFRSSVALMSAGAQMVKLEGGVELAETTRFLTSRGIPVCSHIGLTPQYVHQLGGYCVQGKGDAGARKVIADALAQQEAGASLIVLEAIPSTVAAEITQQLSVPTIGIGAGKHCSGQVLVLHDMLDISPGKKARFVRNFMDGQSSIADAISSYVAAVKEGSFPSPEHGY